MLEEAENPDTGFSKIVTWLPDGKAFKIYDQEAFVETIMKIYFNQSKIKSFTRQLYIYGFLKIPNGPNEGAFYHPDFVRDDKQSCFSLRRNQVGDRRRVKAATRRGSASSNTSTSSAESSSHSSVGPSHNTTNTYSSIQQKANRRKSLSDYVSGRPSMTFSNLMPLRRSSLGTTSLPRSPSMGLEPTSERRNSLSEFFDHALNLLPTEDAYATLPCLDALSQLQSNETLTSYRVTSIGYFAKHDLQVPRLSSHNYPEQSSFMAPQLPQATNFVTPTTSCNYPLMEQPLADIETSSLGDDDLWYQMELVEPKLNGGTIQ